jgi:arginyl-tRNA synthetase
MGQTVKGIDVIDEAKKVAREKISVANDYDQETKQRIIDAVALAGLKFLILSHEFRSNINYDPEEFIKLKGFSGPFILYSYVRTQSVLRKSGALSLILDFNEHSVLKTEERALLQSLIAFPDVVEEAGLQAAPHHICNYLYGLSQKFNIFYENCSVLGAEDEKTKTLRLTLTQATGQVLKNGLEMLGIDTVEVM